MAVFLGGLGGARPHGYCDLVVAASMVVMMMMVVVVMVPLV